MTAVVGPTVPVLHSPSSADFSAGRFPPNVASYVSFHSTSLSFFSPSTLSGLRESVRRTRKRVVEAREGSSLVNNELAHGHEEFGARQSVSGRNILSADDGKLSWALHSLQARNIKASAMHHRGHSKFSTFAHTFESHDRNDSISQNQNEALHKQSRSSADVQHRKGSFIAKKHPRAPLLTQNQQSRLHNEVTIFEGITEPRSLGFSGDDDTHHEDADDADEGPTKLNTERLEHKQSPQKGTLFMSQLEEELSNFKKKVDVPKQSSTFIEEVQRGASASFVHAAQGFQKLTSKGQGVHANGVQINPKGKDTQMASSFDVDNSVEDATRTKANYDSQGQHGEGDCIAREGLQSGLGQSKLLQSKTARKDEAGFSSFNLFSSSPSIPWEANRRYPSTCVPISKSRRPLGRHLSTSIGSRSSPSQRSVTMRRNKGHSKFGLQVTSDVDGALKISGEETQRNLRSDGIYAMKAQGETEIDSLKGAVRYIEQEGNLVKLESQAESSMIVDALESGKKEELVKPSSAGNKDVITQGAPDVEDKVNSAFSNAEKVMPLKSSPSAMSLHTFHNHDYSDSEDNMTDGSEFPDAKGNVSTVAKSDLAVFPNCEDDMCNQSNVNARDDDEVFIVFSDSEDDLPTSSSSSEVDGRNAHAHDTIQLNGNDRSSKNKKPVESANWHKHNLPDLPFEFQFSYSETPQRPILSYREPPFSPFGPSNMKRPWIGDRPNNPSKKKPRVFDSFHPPPRNLKGVKAVQDPGPYPEGQGPKAAKSREEIMGETLTKEEIVYLVEKCRRETRQLNLGRDGVTHNMLDLIHSHWKRRRVCRVKCKGVPTVDMENVKYHLEEKTGGKIIYQTGGVLYLFRGRNYNYKDRPCIPLMLWKPATPVYPKLIQPAPEGLTEEEAQRLRRLGRKVKPLCKLGKNGVYLTLVDEVRAAFTVDELVRVDCRGLNSRDYKKIGAKLRDLVPCVLLSFDREYILMWKGKRETTDEGTSALEASDSEIMADNGCNGADYSDPSIDEGDRKPPPTTRDSCEVGKVSSLLARLNVCSLQREGNKKEDVDLQLASTEALPSSLSMHQVGDHKDTSVGLATNKGQGDKMVHNLCEVEEVDSSLDSPNMFSLQSEENSREDVDLQLVSMEALPSSYSIHHEGDSKDTSAGLTTNKEKNGPSDYVGDIDALWEHAFQSGMAIELLEEDMDSDLIVRKADELAKLAPLAPQYTIKLMYKLQLKRDPDYQPNDELRIHFGRVPTKKPKKQIKRKFQLPTVGVPGMGGLPVDDLAKLLVKK